MYRLALFTTPGAEAWTPRQVLERHVDLRVYLSRWKKILQDAGRDSVEYRKALKLWQEKHTRAKIDNAEKPSEPQSLYYFKRPWREPGVLFNGMLNPVTPYTIKGVLWY